MKRELRYVALFLAILAATSDAQPIVGDDPMRGPNVRPSVGGFGSLNLSMAQANFTQLPNVPDCNAIYRSGSGIGPSFGVFYEMPLANSFSIMLRGVYSIYGEKLTSNEQSPILINGTETPAVIEHSIQATLGMVGLQPMASYYLSPALSIRIGGEIGWVIQSSFSQIETLTQPTTTGKFENGLRTRNLQSGKIPNANTVVASLVGGISYHLPLNRTNTLQAVPELSYSFGLTPVIKNFSWSVNAFRGGIAIRYIIPEIPVELPRPPVIDTVVPSPSAVPPFASIVAKGVDRNGEETSAVVIHVEEVYSIRMTPLLPYIFFEHKEQTVPPRYNKIESDAASDFTEIKLKHEDALAINHQTLNVIGKRLTEDPDATITLAGIILHGVIDKKLALLRAQTAAAYLQLIWHIPESRIRITTHPLAKETIAALDSDGIAEANRVEIASSSFDILQPVLCNDTLRTVSPPTIRFYPSVMYSEKITHWDVTATQEGKLLKSYEGISDIPERIDWIMWDDQSAIPRYPGKLDFSLNVVGAYGDKSKASGSLSVEQLSLRKKRIQRIADREIEKYNLLLFDLQSSELSETNKQIVELIQEHLKDISTITIIGHTDRTGESKLNKRLSLERAKNTAHALGVTKAEIRGIANETILYDNTLPEGRCLSRTVDIIIETPIDQQ